MIIGICGKSGCGKSTLANKLVQTCENTINLDIDKIGHNVLNIEEVQHELVNSFGNNILNNNMIDRKQLGNIVFASRLEMKKLSHITWKHMQIQIDKFLADTKDKVVVLDWLLLPKTKYFKMCDIKILLDIPYETRMNRAIKRDNISKEAFDLREKASIDFDTNSFDYVMQENSEDIIERLVNLI